MSPYAIQQGCILCTRAGAVQRARTPQTEAYGVAWHCVIASGNTGSQHPSYPCSEPAQPACSLYGRFCNHQNPKDTNFGAPATRCAEELIVAQLTSVHGMLLAVHHTPALVLPGVLFLAWRVEHQKMIGDKGRLTCHAESVLEVWLDAHFFQPCVDLWATTVHQHRLDPNTS